MVNHGLVLDLVERVGAVARHDTVSVPIPDGDTETARRAVAAWCARTGNELVEITDGSVVVRRGPSVDHLAELDPNQVPGTRLWIYTNFDCNLACDYCCARSSPQADRNGLGLDRVRRLAAEAVDAGVSELILTGGEPFLLTDIDEVVQACTVQLPTTLLTNGMLFRGRRLEALRRMDRSRLALQISLDSATADLHDGHRGKGSWAKAVSGIQIARAEGFRVRVAATLPMERTRELGPFHEFLDGLGIEPGDQVIRTLAHRGFATEGIELTRESLIPEVTVTADGVYWHPVSAGHDDHLVTRKIFPLGGAIEDVRRQFVRLRADADSAAQWFPCA
jgi:hypothetical protein